MILIFTKDSGQLFFHQIQTGRTSFHSVPELSGNSLETEVEQFEDLVQWPSEKNEHCGQQLQLQW